MARPIGNKLRMSLITHHLKIELRFNDTNRTCSDMHREQCALSLWKLIASYDVNNDEI